MRDAGSEDDAAVRGARSGSRRSKSAKTGSGMRSRGHTWPDNGETILSCDMGRGHSTRTPNSNRRICRVEQRAKGSAIRAELSPPCGIFRPFFDLRRGSLGADPLDEDLSALGLTVREVCDPTAVRRPAWIAALHKKPIVRPVGGSNDASPARRFRSMESYSA